MTCSLSSNRENQKERKIAANVGKDRKPAAVFKQEQRSGAKTASWSCNERKKKALYLPKRLPSSYECCDEFVMFPKYDTLRRVGGKSGGSGVMRYFVISEAAPRGANIGKLARPGWQTQHNGFN
jgi:hypothetical protein